VVPAAGLRGVADSYADCVQDAFAFRLRYRYGGRVGYGVFSSESGVQCDVYSDCNINIYAERKQDGDSRFYGHADCYVRVHGVFYRHKDSDNTKSDKYIHADRHDNPYNDPDACEYRDNDFYPDAERECDSLHVTKRDSLGVSYKYLYKNTDPVSLAERDMHGHANPQPLVPNPYYYVHAGYCMG
jgi:hypothetical protein